MLKRIRQLWCSSDSITFNVRRTYNFLLILIYDSDDQRAVTFYDRKDRYKKEATKYNQMKFEFKSLQLQSEILLAKL